MKCMKCGKTAFKSFTSEAIELGFGLLVIRNIPCYKCEECDEIFYTGDVVQKIERIIKEAKTRMEKVNILYYDDVA
ncbi:MAG: YgiT-type zinc finger protein [Clostridia bacterium]|nr:YgiT-type zinc finger protein [Clostridia bacterium]